jgi:hypothetical protein
MPGIMVLKQSKKEVADAIAAASERVRLALGLPSPEPIDRRTSEAWDGVLESKQIAETLNAAADVLEARPATTKGVKAS